MPDRALGRMTMRHRPTRTEPSSGTVTTYRCRDCGGTWVWRNTPEGVRRLAETQVIHGGQLYPIGPRRDL
ncbi:exonuclease [Gordonia phage Kiko]|nr:exonuclease [Gordonia phage Kiko]